MVDIAVMRFNDWRRAQEACRPVLIQGDRVYPPEDPYGTGIGLWKKGLSYRITLTPQEKADIHDPLIHEDVVVVYVDTLHADQNVARLIATVVTGVIPGTAVFSAGEDRIVVADEENHELVFASVAPKEEKDLGYMVSMPCSVLRFVWPMIIEIEGVASAFVA